MNRSRLRLVCGGVVQGVGLRPRLARLATALGLVGSVANVRGGVRIDLQGERPALESFLARLPQELPAAARLEPLRPRWLAPRWPAPRGVQLVAAAPRPLGVGLVAPSLCADRAPCAACLAELADPADRRHGYAFLSCSDCGPRYSIATAEPYARGLVAARRRRSFGSGVPGQCRVVDRQGDLLPGGQVCKFEHSRYDFRWTGTARQQTRTWRG